MNRNRMPPKYSRARGFTLIEVLVALLVLSIALAAAIRTVGASIDTTAALRDRTLARWVAEDRLTRYEWQHAWPSIDTREGDAEMGGKAFRWREVVATTPVTRMRRVEVSVFLPGTDAALARLTGFLEQPSTQSAAASQAASPSASPSTNP